MLITETHDRQEERWEETAQQEEEPWKAARRDKERQEAARRGGTASSQLELASNSKILYTDSWPINWTSLILVILDAELLCWQFYPTFFKMLSNISLLDGRWLALTSADFPQGLETQKFSEQ